MEVGRLVLLGGTALDGQFCGLWPFPHGPKMAAAALGTILTSQRRQSFSEAFTRSSVRL